MPPTATPVPGSSVLYFSLGSNGAVDGLSVANEDIVAWDGEDGFTRYFDGSDVGLGGFRLDAFAIISPAEILMSFTAAGSIDGISGTVDDSDIVKFTASTLGDTTTGSFTLFFDGSDVGLTSSSEDIDAIELLPNGDLLLSTRSSFSANGVSGADEDIFACNSLTPGPNTACESLTLYFDGSDVGLTNSSEDVDGLALDADGNIYLSTTRNFSVPGRSGADEDVFIFQPSFLGGTTSGSYQSTLFFDGSVYGVGGNDLYAIDLP